MAYLLTIHSSPFLSVAIETNITALFAATKLCLLILNLILTFFLILYHLVMYPVLRLNQLLTLSCSCQYLYNDFPRLFPVSNFSIFTSFTFCTFRIISPYRLFFSSGFFLLHYSLVTLPIPSK